MADGVNFRRVADIVNADSSRRFVVVSAPGKRYGGDTKITDLLYSAHTALEATGALGESFKKVRERYVSVVRETGLDFAIEELLTVPKRK